MLRIIKKFNQILNKGQKIKIIIIAFMMLLGAILETLGVSLILPLITTILDTNIIETNQYAKMVCEIFDLHSSRTFMILVIAGLILVYLFKNIFLYVEYYVQYRFVYNNRFSTQVKIMEHYLHRPYDFFLNVNSGEITRVLLNDVRAAFDLLTTILNFFTEAVIAVALVITIIIVDPFMALLISGILGILMLVISKVVRPVLRRAGKRYQKNAASSNKWLLQAISGIKELKVSRKESFFLEMFSKYGKRSIDAEKKNSVFSNIPRLLIESISICSVLSVIAVMLFMGKEVESLLPQLSVFALAAVRLLPSANRMSSAMNAMAYQELALDKIIENLSEINTLRNKQNKYNNKNKQNKENITKNNTRNIEKKNNTEKKNISDFQIKSKIEFSNVTFYYSENQEAVLENAQMTIPIGKSIGIIGTSGAGKTTVVDILLGLLKPIKGQVLADGISIEDNYQGWLSQISYIPQMIFMLDDTIRANVAFGIHKDEINEQAVWEAIEEAQLGDFIRGLKEGLDTTIGERGVRLSGGQRQRIGIARALYTNPKLLIFDEATSALDNETEAAIMESINRLQGKKTLIIIAHRLSTIEECDILYRVADGKIICEGKR